MNSTASQSAAPTVVAVCADGRHRFCKPAALFIQLLEGLGVEGDAHCGPTVQHLYDQRRDPARVNLRQVHLIQSELFAELEAAGFTVQAGELGENITTAGLDLMALPEGTRIAVGDEAQIELTGLRNPCKQIDDFQPGLMRAVTERTPAGSVALRFAVMAVVRRSGVVQPGDRLRITLPPDPHRPLKPV